jgi:hypothetical protein
VKAWKPIAAGELLHQEARCTRKTKPHSYLRTTTTVARKEEDSKDSQANRAKISNQDEPVSMLKKKKQRCRPSPSPPRPARREDIHRTPPRTPHLPATTAGRERSAKAADPQQVETTTALFRRRR